MVILLVMAEEKKKTIAFVLYPGLALLDLAGPLQVISALAGGGLDYQVVVDSRSRRWVPWIGPPPRQLMTVT